MFIYTNIILKFTFFSQFSISKKYFEKSMRLDYRLCIPRVRLSYTYEQATP